jgi:glyoxylase-like metal-dependent hydrolase (beta-lactamase superfamily II)
MDLRRVMFLNAGYCRQSGYLAARSHWHWDRFYAVLVYLEHPIHGPALIDTGYSEHFFRATRRLPQCVYRWLTPPTLDPHINARAILQAQGIDPDSIRTLFVSHFHGDHIAGLRCFPHAQFVYRADSLQSLLHENIYQQIRHGFLADLLPADFRARGIELREDQLHPGTGVWSEFRMFDYWNDGSLILVDLPGHGQGHTGYILQTQAAQIFYVVDASWDMQALEQRRTLPWLSRGFQFAYADYVETQSKLRRLLCEPTLTLLACHCPRTQSYVANAQG